MIGTMMVLMMAFLFCSNQASATSTKETAKEISFNTGVTGELSNYNDVDWYKFTIPASIGNVSINVNLAAYSGNPHAEVYDESLNLLGWADSQTSFGGRIQCRLRRKQANDRKKGRTKNMHIRHTSKI